MKYLQGSSFAVHVGGSAYSEGWDRIFRSCSRQTTNEPALLPCAIQETAVPLGCFDCERAHAARQRCFCMCHDDRSAEDGGAL